MLCRPLLFLKLVFRAIYCIIFGTKMGRLKNRKFRDIIPTCQSLILARAHVLVVA
uniref:Uncharacterized protein n=1 Tax=Rhizophora mucronata TaxID=61149 RepID=A0A2P2QYM7_RHIMU